MAQSTITSFYANRKRPIAEDPKARSKVLIMENNAGYVTPCEQNSESQSSARLKLQTTVVFKERAELSTPKPSGTGSGKPKNSKRLPCRKQIKPKEPNQRDMKSFLSTKTSVLEAQDGSERASSENANLNLSSPKVVFELKGLLSPCKINSEEASLPVTEKETAQPESSSEKPAETVNNETRTQERPSCKKELSLDDIKSKLTRSSRLSELKASLARMDEKKSRLRRIEESKKKLFGSDDKSIGPENHNKSKLEPQLNHFSALELEVPTSPIKSPMKSPFKSPQKGPPGPNSPAFKRYSALALPGTPALPLPYSYRHLAELFRCVDTVVSLLFNRKELATFPKLQPAVQEMSRKTFTMHHIAQFLTVYPEAYSVKQEKLGRFASPTKQDKYSIVLTPILPEPIGDGAPEPATMTPSLLLERRRHFFNRLLEVVKKHHEDFLESLDPPLVIPRHQLTRWHPEFVVDEVPEIVPAELPKPPNQDKCSSAKDVLEKARQLYSCNSRMEKALEAVAQNGAGSTGRNVNLQIVDAQPQSAPVGPQPPSSPFKNLQLSSALKGIPKALLEKVRARQAAKALLVMTRTPAQEKEATQYSRLPEIARILRNTFVTEKKETLPLDLILEKVGNSYRSALSRKELEEHLRILAKAVPGWVTFEFILKTDYLKLSKGGDMNRVLTRLQALADEKSGIKSS